MSPKTGYSFRLHQRFVEIVDEAARIRSRELRAPLNRTSFIELAVLAYLEQLSPDSDDWNELMEAMTGVLYDDPETRAAWKSEGDID